MMGALRSQEHGRESIRGMRRSARSRRTSRGCPFRNRSALEPLWQLRARYPSDRTIRETIERGASSSSTTSTRGAAFEEGHLHASVGIGPPGSRIGAVRPSPRGGRFGVTRARLDGQEAEGCDRQPYLVRQRGGNFWVPHRSISRHARLSPPVLRTHMPAQRPVPSSEGRRIVICDYNALLLSVTGLLRMSRFCVFQAHDGLAAQELCVELRDISLLILNTYGTGIDVAELIRGARIVKPGLPVLHIGTTVPNGLPDDVPTLDEDFTSDQLLMTVNALIERRSLPRVGSDPRGALPASISAPDAA
jgi:hypothetical protein